MKWGDTLDLLLNNPEKIERRVQAKGKEPYVDNTEAEWWEQGFIILLALILCAWKFTQ